MRGSSRHEDLLLLWRDVAAFLLNVLNDKDSYGRLAEFHHGLVPDLLLPAVQTGRQLTDSLHHRPERELGSRSVSNPEKSATK